MDKARLTTLIEEPHQLTIDDAKALRKLKVDYPYFQALTPLMVLADKRFEPSSEKKSLPTAAIYSLDRKHLKNFLNEKSSNSFVGTQNTDSHHSSSYNYQQVKFTHDNLKVEEDHLPDSFFNELFVEMESLKKSKEQFRRVLEKLEQEEVKLTIKKPAKTTARKSTSKPAIEKKATNKTSAVRAKKNAASTKSSTTTKKTKPTIKKTTKTSKKNPEELNVEISYDFINEIKLKEKKEINDQHKKEQIALINNFIEKEPILTKKFIENDPDAKRVIEDLSVSSTSLSEDVISETLAKLMIKQGRNQKAIDIYKKLIWKFPQKKTYFAEQIENLKREQ